VVTDVGDIWRARGALAYNGGLGAEPPAGSRGRAHGGGSGGEAPSKLKDFGKATQNLYINFPHLLHILYTVYLQLTLLLAYDVFPVYNIAELTAF